jgi:hypothetical protein
MSKNSCIFAELNIKQFFMSICFNEYFKVIGEQKLHVLHVVLCLTTAPLFCFHNFILRFGVAVQTSTATFFYDNNNTL